MEFAIFLLSILLVSSSSIAADFGAVKLVQGEASYDGKALHAGDPVRAGGVVETGPRSMVRILLEAGVAMQIGPASRVELAAGDRAGPPVAEILRGALLSRIRKGGTSVKYRVKSRSVSLGV